MSCVGFDLIKGELYYFMLDGSKKSPIYINHEIHRFDPTQSRTEMMNFFKQTFLEIVRKENPDKISYRLSINAKKAIQFGYLAFPFGVLNLIAYENNIPIEEWVLQSFSTKALGYKADKFSACEEMISNFPATTKKEARIAALAAWMSL